MWFPALMIRNLECCHNLLVIKQRVPKGKDRKSSSSETNEMWRWLQWDVIHPITEQCQATCVWADQWSQIKAATVQTMTNLLCLHQRLAFLWRVCRILSISSSSSTIMQTHTQTHTRNNLTYFFWESLWGAGPEMLTYSFIHFFMIVHDKKGPWRCEYKHNTVAEP